jgi:hypothetical protein
MSDFNNSFGSRLKAKLLHLRVRQLSKQNWRVRYKKVFKQYPEYRRPCSQSVESEHLAMWRALRPDINLDTVRLCAALSGRPNSAIIPEEVYVSEVERCLNRHSEAAYLNNKSFFNRWMPGAIFPQVFIHNIEGEFYNTNYQLLDPTSLEELLDSLPYPVVLKPSLGPGGGRGVCFPTDKTALKQQMRGKEDYIVQERIRQHEFLEQFNRHGLNTFRVYTYKSVITNEVHVLIAALRMGKGGSLDNETAGGILCPLTNDGVFTPYAVDKWATKYFKHPDTGIEFAAVGQMPQFDGMTKLVKQVARELYRTRLIGMDACLDTNGHWRMIEVNLFGHAPRFAQYGGFPFFGRFTQEVIEYCRKHPNWR